MVRWRHPRFKPWTVGCLFILGVLLAIGCAVNYWAGEDLRANGLRASATVTAVNHGKATTWDLAFTDEYGQPQKIGGVENLKGKPKIGGQVEIYYIPTDPTNSDEVTDVRYGPPGHYQFSAATKMGLFALIPLAAGVYGAVVSSRDEEQRDRRSTP